jgi:DNA excision repair protein ERCC-2
MRQRALCLQGLHIDVTSLKFACTRLNSLLRTVQVSDVDECTPLQLVADFVTLMATHPQGFLIILEQLNATVPHAQLDPVHP